MLPILQIGPLAIQTPGLILLASLWVGLWLSEKFAHQRNLSIDDLYNLVFSMLTVGILGARLGYFAQSPSSLQDNPLAIFALDPILFDPFSGMLFGLLAGFVYGYRKKLSLRPLLDTLAPTISMLMLGLGLANLASGSGFGSETTLPWGISLWGATRHPSQIYESLAAALILLVVLIKWNKEILVTGHLFLKFIIFTAGSKLLLEAFRGDSQLIMGGFRSNQIFAWIILAISLWIFWQSKQSTQPTINQ